MGYSFHKLKKFYEAIDCYKEVLRIDPEFKEAHNQIGISYNMLNKY